jgi:hypothetical protein
LKTQPHMAALQPKQLRARLIGKQLTPKAADAHH